MHTSRKQEGRRDQIGEEGLRGTAGSLAGRFGAAAAGRGLAEKAGEKGSVAGDAARPHHGTSHTFRRWRRLAGRGGVWDKGKQGRHHQQLPSAPQGWPRLIKPPGSGRRRLGTWRSRCSAACYAATRPEACSWRQHRRRAAGAVRCRRWPWSCGLSWWWRQRPAGGGEAVCKHCGHGERCWVARNTDRKGCTPLPPAALQAGGGGQGGDADGLQAALRRPLAPPAPRAAAQALTRPAAASRTSGALALSSAAARSPALAPNTFVIVAPIKATLRVRHRMSAGSSFFGAGPDSGMVGPLSANQQDPTNAGRNCEADFTRGPLQEVSASLGRVGVALWGWTGLPWPRRKGLAINHG